MCLMHGTAVNFPSNHHPQVPLGHVPTFSLLKTLVTHPSASDVPNCAHEDTHCPNEDETQANRNGDHGHMAYTGLHAEHGGSEEVNANANDENGNKNENENKNKNKNKNRDGDRDQDEDQNERVNTIM
ncbi:hypothetical protein BS47DRAFT_1369448 [Hydnum rufescens UP504]|uniref:Uncharacterized protein n=1 Tax=Hydnum rufescens UP504 TaxID=1448309 RepID=A0A9P6AD53_9AGAM|nr:hypothetical protein BS47DRAFT_1369448 [Hydnum rufescens UP504]